MTTPSPSVVAESLGVPKGRRFSRISPENNDSSSFFNSNDKIDKKVETTSLKSSYIPPWTEPYIIGVAGNSGSGKTSVSQKIIQELNQPWTVLLSFDNFYNPLNEEERKLAHENRFDFDMPNSFDLDLVYETVKSLKKGQKCSIPLYSFKNHNRTSKTTTIYGANVIIVEGIYALHDPRLLELMDLKIYVDTALDVCLARRLTRDILHRGRDLTGALKQWETYVKPNAVRYVNPTMNNADLILPKGLENDTAINLMIRHIQKQLAMKSALHLKHLKSLGVNTSFNVDSVDNLKLLPTTNQTRGINSILLDESTERSDFIFYFDRISVLIIETAMELLDNYEFKLVGTSSEHPLVTANNEGEVRDVSLQDSNPYKFQGLHSKDDIIAVNIIRSGDCFMNSLMKTVPEVTVGKLLIQSDSQTGEPQLHYDSLPKDISGENKKIFLFDSQIISGAAAIMAIQVLIDHKVTEKNIILCSYLSTEVGLRRVKRVFPMVQVVIGKLSSMEEEEEVKWYNEEGFRDNNWHFRNRWVDSLYFGSE